jgi:hypothetical protein
MELLFAAAEIKDKETIVEREFAALGRHQVGFSEEVLFDYYWLWIYFNHALENFSKALEIAQEAVDFLRMQPGAKNKINIVRIELKINEFLYCLSRFAEAYKSYQRVIYSPILETLPDRSYHMTKYIQLSLITGDIDEAGRILTDKLNQMGDRVEQLIIVRDIVTYVKYCLFKGDYPTAFRFIQLGFEKTPKGKYFQYELELRNLQTAYFFLNHQEDVAIDLCQKHTKFLRNHGYTITTSSYPHFFLLTKALFEKENGKANIRARHQKGASPLSERELCRVW